MEKIETFFVWNFHNEMLYLKPFHISVEKTNENRRFRIVQKVEFHGIICSSILLSKIAFNKPTSYLQSLPHSFKSCGNINQFFNLYMKRIEQDFNSKS